ncbi:MAG: hypothetical protein KGJ00_20350, partial [Bradyrhizobium sp.]|nr:hypothetical protein [Bradyrhizobium sp.]
PSGSGTVSKQDFVSTMSKLMVSLRAEGTSPGGSASLSSSLQSLNQIDPTTVSTDSPPGSLINYSA